MAVSQQATGVLNSYYFSSTAHPRRAVVLYHYNCLDGLGARMAMENCLAIDSVGEALYSDITYVEIDYPQLQQWVDNYDHGDVTDIYCLDISLTQAQAFELLSGRPSRRVIIIDHHDTALREWSEYRLPEHVHARQLQLFLDSGRYSGALLSYFYFEDLRYQASMELVVELTVTDSRVTFIRGEARDLDIAPDLLRMISDRDLYQFLIPGSREICTALLATGIVARNDVRELSRIAQALEHNVPEWDKWFSMGEILIKTQTQDIRSILKTTFRTTVIGTGHHVGIAQMPYIYASYAAEILYTEHAELDFIITYEDQVSVTNPKELYRKWSFRSRKDSPLHLGELVKELTNGVGGGHRNAAGFMERLVENLDVPEGTWSNR